MVCDRDIASQQESNTHRAGWALPSHLINRFESGLHSALDFSSLNDLVLLKWKNHSIKCKATEKENALVIRREMVIQRQPRSSTFPRSAYTQFLRCRENYACGDIVSVSLIRYTYNTYQVLRSSNCTLLSRCQIRIAELQITLRKTLHHSRTLTSLQRPLNWREIHYFQHKLEPFHVELAYRRR